MIAASIWTNINQAYISGFCFLFLEDSIENAVSQFSIHKMKTL